MRPPVFFEKKTQEHLLLSLDLGANGGNRTHGLFITSELLYP